MLFLLSETISTWAAGIFFGIFYSFNLKKLPHDGTLKQESYTLKYTESENVRLECLYRKKSRSPYYVGVFEKN